MHEFGGESFTETTAGVIATDVAGSLANGSEQPTRERWVTDNGSGFGGQIRKHADRNILCRGVIAIELAQRRVIDKGQVPVYQTLECAFVTFAGKSRQERFRSFGNEFFHRQLTTTQPQKRTATRKYFPIGPAQMVCVEGAPFQTPGELLAANCFLDAPRKGRFGFLDWYI